LGFVINSKEMVVTAPEKKFARVLNTIRETLNLRVVKTKQLAAVAILIISLEASHEFFARISTRSSYRQISQTVDEKGWKSWLNLEQETVDKLNFFLVNLRE